MNLPSHRPYGFGRFLPLVLPIAISSGIVFEVWQTKSISSLEKEQVEFKVWRAGIPKQMQVEEERLRLDILSTVGITMQEIQKGQIRLEVSLEDIKRRLGNRSEVPK